MFNDLPPLDPQPRSQPSQTHSRDAAATQTELIEKILQDPLLLRRLSDRVYHLMLEEMRLQHDRWMR